MTTAFQLDDQQVLEEDYDEDYEPTEEEILEYCKVLGLDPVKEKDLLYIAKEGIKAPLPEDWKPVEDTGGNIYYFNFVSGESTWEHPCDEFYCKLLNQEREKRANTTEPTEDMRAQKRRLTLKGRGQNEPPNGRGAGPPPLGKLPTKSDPPVHSKLAPLSLGGPKPLSSLGNLPPLKTPSSLAPLRMAPSLAQGAGDRGKSLGGSLSTTGGSRLSEPQSREEGTGVRLGTGLGLGTVRISTEFVEEDSESESDFGFKSKLGGMNLLGAEELGIKDSEDDIDSTEDVSKELRKIMDMSSDREENSSPSVAVAKRPSPPLPGVRPGVVSPRSSPRFLRPGGARTRTRLSPSNSPAHSTPSSPSRTRSNGVRLGTGASSASTSPPDPVNILHASNLSAAKTLKSEQSDEVQTLRAQNEIEISKLKQQFAQELQEAKERLSKENEHKLHLYKEQLDKEKQSEEKRLRAEKMVAIEDIRSTIDEEKEDEEARIEESKQDYIRKLKQQLSVEKEKEEIQLKSDNSEAINQIQKQLTADKRSTEERIRSEAAHDLQQMKEELEKEIEAERERVREALEKELRVVRDSKESEIRRKTEEVESEHQQQLNKLEELKTKHKKDVQGALAEVESSLDIEGARTEATLAHQRAVEELQEELARELQKKKETIQTQHKQELESTTDQLKQELAQAKSEWADKISTEKEILSKELKCAKDQIQQKHDEEIKLLQQELQSSQADLEHQSQLVSQQLSGLQAENSSKREELQTVKDQLSQEEADIEAQKLLLVKEREEYEMEEKQLAQLREASSQEREELLKKQQQELREAIQAENKRLDKLKKMHRNLKSEVEKLKQERNSTQLSLESLEQCKTKLHQELSDLKRHRTSVGVKLTTEKESDKLHSEEEASVDDTVSSMVVEELEPLPSVDSQESITAHIGHRVEQRQKALYETLDREKQSLKDTKKFLTRQHKPDTEQKKEPKLPRFELRDSNLSLLKEIRAKLDQEAAVLKELEDRMRLSNKPVTIQDTEMDNVFTSQEEDEPVMDDDLAIATDIPSPKSYLTKLHASLERSKKFTDPVKTRHLSSPLPSVRRAAPESSVETSSEHETHQPEHKRSHSEHYSPATVRILENSGRAANDNSVIHDSLNMINTQLSRLLTRLPETPTLPIHPIMPQPALPFPEPLIPSSLEAPRRRWAEPAQRLNSSDLDFSDRRRSFQGSQPNTATPTVPSLLRSSIPTRPTLSTEELISHQTDWLKEFRQSVPLTSQQTLRGRTTKATQPTVLPSKPKLVLDQGNTIKLVHI